MNILTAKSASDITKNNRHVTKYSKGFLYCMELINIAVECLNSNVTVQYLNDCSDIINSNTVNGVVKELELFGYAISDDGNSFTIMWGEEALEAYT